MDLLDELKKATEILRGNNEIIKEASEHIDKQEEIIRIKDRLIILQKAEIESLNYQVNDLLKTIENIKNGSLN